MRKGMNLLFIIFRDVMMLATFILAVMLENAKGERLVQMIVLFSLFLLWMHLRELFQEKAEKILAYTFLLDAVLLAFLDASSKFVVNYYFNIYYFFVLISAGFLLKQKQRLLLSFVIIAVAFIKYYRLIEAKTVYNLPFVVSYIFFTLMVFVTVSIFFNYSRLLSEEKSRLNKLNEDLQRVNRLLEEKNERIKELTIFEERNRIAREIHDSVGHNLTGLIMNLDFCEKLAGIEPQKAGAQIAACRDIAKECLTEIRRSVKALKPQAVEQLPLVKAVEELIHESKQKFNLKTGLKIEGEIYKTKPEFNIVIYRAIQESITNAIRHGKASEIDVTIAFGKPNFSVLIRDNGEGSKKIKLGSGLSGMVERVRELKGEVNFFTNNGFMTSILIPMGVAESE
ncbi:MAG: sensor histidine kinase [Clostridia bacterium]|nr:sensor histidine kinase [Clostridia bacterium]